MKPALTGAKVEFESPETVIERSPNEKNMPYVFKNEVFNLFLLLNKEKLKDSGEILLSFNDTRTSQTKTFKISYDINNHKNSLYLKGKDLYKLVARHIVKDYASEKNTVKERDISLKYGVLSSQTSFIAVEKNTGASGQGQMEVRKVPIVVHKQQIPNPSYDIATAGSRSGLMCVNMRKRSVAASNQMPTNSIYASSGMNLMRSYSSSSDEEQCRSIKMKRESVEKKKKKKKTALDSRTHYSDKIQEIVGSSHPSLSYNEVLKSQNIDGAWRDNNLKKLDKSISKLFDAIPIQISDAVNDKNELVAVWITLLILVYLEKKQAALESEWKLIARKGKNFLKKQGIDYEANKALVVFENII